MYIGPSIFLIAIGAILKYAVTATLAGISIQTVGVILMVAGGIGLIASLFLELSAGRRAPRDVEVVREREPVVRERF
jgi:L-cystine uptake protein TcyP (sodium:dicarboxylate symporter family)